MGVFTIPKIAFDYIEGDSFKRLIQGGYGNTNTTYNVFQVLITSGSIRYNSAMGAGVTSNSGKMKVYYR